MDTPKPPSPPLSTVPDLLAWCQRAPTGTRLDAQEVARILANGIPESREEEGDRPEPAPDAWTWRERVWTVPAETRMGVVEVAEAMDRPKSWVYGRTGPSARCRIPHRKMDGVCMFTAGELRAWIRQNEEDVVGGPMESTADERGELRVLR